MDRLFSNKKINNSRQDIKGYYCYTCDAYCMATCTRSCNSNCSGRCTGNCGASCIAYCDGMAGVPR